MDISVDVAFAFAYILLISILQKGKKSQLDDDQCEKVAINLRKGGGSVMKEC